LGDARQKNVCDDCKKLIDELNKPLFKKNLLL